MESSEKQRSATDVDQDDFYNMANLFPRHTGLPFVIWISVRGNARHDIRVKISPGPKAQPDEMVSVGVRPDVHVIDGRLNRKV